MPVEHLIALKSDRCRDLTYVNKGKIIFFFSVINLIAMLRTHTKRWDNFMQAIAQTIIASKAGEGYFDLMGVFQSCPIIYTLLLLMSVLALSVWFYSMLTLRLSDLMPKNFIAQVRELFLEKRYDAALVTCQGEHSFAAAIIAAGILSRKHGVQMMLESMKSEGKRSAILEIT